MFCDRMDVEKPQRVPLSVFRHCETLARQSVHFLVCNFFKKKISKNFQFSTTVNEYLTLGSLFAIFEPWIWRRLGSVPACFSISPSQLCSHTPCALMQVGSGATCHIAIPQCCYSAKGAKRPSHATNMKHFFGLVQPNFFFGLLRPKFIFGLCKPNLFSDL